jgi:hypothetical protein
MLCNNRFNTTSIQCINIELSPATCSDNLCFAIHLTQYCQFRPRLNVQQLIHPIIAMTLHDDAISDSIVIALHRTLIQFKMLFHPRHLKCAKSTNASRRCKLRLWHIMCLFSEQCRRNDVMQLNACLMRLTESIFEYKFDA